MTDKGRVPPQYTWNPSSEWSSYYSGAPEILDYFKKTAAEYKLDRNVKLNHLLVGATWGEDDNLWHFKFQTPSGEIVEDSANLFVNATGVLKYVPAILVLLLLHAPWLTHPPPGRPFAASGSGPRSLGGSRSRGRCSTVPTGTRLSPSRASGSPSSARAPRPCRSSPTSSTVRPSLSPCPALCARQADATLPLGAFVPQTSRP